MHYRTRTHPLHTVQPDRSQPPPRTPLPAATLFSSSDFSPLFEGFPDSYSPVSEPPPPDFKLLLETLDGELQLSILQLQNLKAHHQQRQQLSEIRQSEIVRQIEYLNTQLHRISHFAPGYRSSIDAQRNALLSEKLRLYRDRAEEQVELNRDLNQFEQSYLAVLKQYQSLAQSRRLLTDFDA